MRRSNRNISATSMDWFPLSFPVIVNYVHYQFQWWSSFPILISHDLWLVIIFDDYGMNWAISSDLGFCFGSGASSRYFHVGPSRRWKITMKISMGHGIEINGILVLWIWSLSPSHVDALGTGTSCFLGLVTLFQICRNHPELLIKNNPLGHSETWKVHS